MIDIVERARLYAIEPWAHQDNWHDLMNALADEIERLRAENERFRGYKHRLTEEIERLRVVLRDQAGVELSEENDRLIAEIERLQGIIQFMDAAKAQSIIP